MRFIFMRSSLLITVADDIFQGEFTNGVLQIMFSSHVLCAFWHIKAESYIYGSVD